MENENFRGPKPTPDPNNIMTNPPPSHSCPGLGLPEMADNNQATGAGPMASTIAVNIPAASDYGIEVDYAECCNGQLTLVVSPFFTQTLHSQNYAGYAAIGTQNNPAVFTDVTATWTVPTASCTLIPAETSESATWDGLGDNATDLEQIGTESDCSHGFSAYFGVWEVIQGGNAPGAQKIDPNAFPVSAGDNVKVEVKFLSLGQFSLDIWNLSNSDPSTNHWSQVVSGDNSTKAIALAECIQEDPLPSPLTNFGSVTITCTANNQPIGSAGPIIQKFLMDKPYTKADTGDLNASGLGDTFTVDWAAS